MKYLKLFARVICIGLIAWYMYTGLDFIFEIHDSILFDGKYEADQHGIWLLFSWLTWLLFEALILIGILWFAFHLLICIPAIALGKWDYVKYIWENRIKNIK